MINIIDKAKCTGCEACVQRCPKLCIDLIRDGEGFLYPKVDTNLCIDCSLCEKVCPVINQREVRKPLLVCAAKTTDDAVRLSSSSGGIFTILAEKIISEGGKVYGARFDSDWSVRHDCVEIIDDLEKFRGSKYVQSRIGDSFKDVEMHLKSGKKVLFTGVPCQIAGLKNYLRKDYGNLIAVDIVCHGVPSPMVWNDYLASLNCNGIQSINFRAKQDEGYSWKGYGMVIKGIDDFTILSQKASENLYLRGFASNLFLRPSCYSCPAKSGKSGSDITIGDFWGIWNKFPELDDNKGMSMVLINTAKGQNLFDSLNVDKKPSSYEDAVNGNPMLQSSTAKPKDRQQFWEAYAKAGIDCLPDVLKRMQPSLASRVLSSVRYHISKIFGR